MFLDLSTAASNSSSTQADARSCAGYVKESESTKALEIAKRSDAVIIVAPHQNSYIPKRIFELVGMKLNKENMQNSCVWDNCGVCCMIVANAKRRQRVAKELWAILNSSYDRLDVSDFLPFGRPIKYHCDPKLETAGPCVV